MRGWAIGICALLTGEAAQAQGERLAFECTGAVSAQSIYLADPASNSGRTEPRRTVFIIDEAKGKVFTYSTELARYVEFCPECKKVWSTTAVAWSDDYTEIKYDRLWYKSTSEGRFDWQHGTTYDRSFISHYERGGKETGQSKEHAVYPRCVKVDVDTYDFESLASFPQQHAARAAIREPAPRRAPSRQDWSVQSLPDGAELRFLPLPITKKDYPKTAARADVEGTSVLNLQVDTSGQITSCATARTSGSPILDQQACRLYRERGHFELRGTTQPVTFETAVQWVLMD